MTGRAVILRRRARRDVDEAVDHYRREAGPEVALAFVDALERGFERIAESPGIGSPRYGFELGLDGLRSRRLRRFPYLIFYREGVDAIDVWRVLHAMRDIPSWLEEA